jgi:hypothetical protein
MENLYYNLSEEDTKGRKVLLWLFTALFFLAGVYILTAGWIFEQKSIPAVLSVVPFGISLIVSVIAAFDTIKRKDMFFSIDHDKIEFRYGLFKPKIHSFIWNDVKELVMPHRQKKIKLVFNNGSSFVINLNWIQKHKSEIIRKHIYHAARERDLNVLKVNILKKNN